MEINEIIEGLKNVGFETVAELDVSTLKVLPQVREMCAVNTCGMYKKRWSCPPGCGELDECQNTISRYSKGILVQTVGDIEDSFDWEGIMEVKEHHNKRYLQGAEYLNTIIADVLRLGDGACTRCKECTYPDSPCRFPELANASMEAFGLFVSDVCKKNNTKYNYGPGKMCYTGCYLYN